MIDKEIRERIYYYLNKMKKLKNNTSKLLNTYNLYNYLILNYDNINYLEFKFSCYNKIFYLIEDINNIKIDYFYKKKIISKLLEFKLLYENNL